MTPFEFVREYEKDGLRARVVKCMCGAETCTTHYLVAQYGHDVLWVAVGWMEADEILDSIEMLYEPDGDGKEVVEAGLALHGMTWDALSSVEIVAAQSVLFGQTPDWMISLPLERLWAIRGCVFGNDLRRVPTALKALHEAYVNEGPAVVRR